MPRTQPAAAAAAKITPAPPNNTDLTADQSRPQDSVETVIKLNAAADQSAIAAKPTRARPGRPAKPAASLPKLPHERDESINTTGTVASEPMEQAARDVKRGLVDTDRGAEAGRTYKKLKQTMP